MIEKLREVARLSISNDNGKYELIYNILNDERFFEKIKIGTAYSILIDLGFKENDLKKNI